MAKEKSMRHSGKDTVFRDMFSKKKYLIQMYKALHPECQNRSYTLSIPATKAAILMCYLHRRKTPSFSDGDIRRVSFAGSMPVKDTIQRR